MGFPVHSVGLPENRRHMTWGFFPLGLRICGLRYLLLFHTGPPFPQFWVWLTFSAVLQNTPGTPEATAEFCVCTSPSGFLIHHRISESCFSPCTDHLPLHPVPTAYCPLGTPFTLFPVGSTGTDNLQACLLYLLHNLGSVLIFLSLGDVTCGVAQGSRKPC